MRIPKELAARCLALAGETPAEAVPLANERVHYRIFGIRIPGLVVVSEANTGGKLWAKIQRKTAIKQAVSAALLRLQVATSPPTPPFRVLLHRMGKQLLDDDNLAHAFKAVRDSVAEWLRVDDGDTARITFAYSQVKSKTVGIQIDIHEV
jgi:hypothetical protein